MGYGEEHPQGPHSEGPVGPGQDDEGRKANGLMSVNDLKYVLEPDLSVAVNKTHKKHFCQSQSYTPNQQCVCILNSGADYIDTRRSFLTITCRFNTTEFRAGKGYNEELKVHFGKNGSILNIIDCLSICTRSGDTICNIKDVALLNNMLIPLEHDKDWRNTVGNMMGMDQMMDENTPYRFCIPLHILAPFFQYGRLLPSMIMSGLRIQITFKQPESAFYLTRMPQHGGYETFNPNKNTSDLANELFTYGGLDPTVSSTQVVYEDSLMSVRNYEIDEIYMNLSSIQLSDSIQRSLNVMSSHNGLELVYTDWEYNSHCVNECESVHVEIRKSCSRALKAIARIRNNSETAYDPHKLDGETQFPVLSYQWQLGSLYFPQQPVKGATPKETAVEAYAHCLEAFNKFHCDGKQPMNVFRNHSHSGSIIRDMALFGKNSPAGRTLTVPGHSYADHFAEEGTWWHDSHVIAVNLERSSLFNLAGVPLNNSRVLAFDCRLSKETQEITKVNPQDHSAPMPMGTDDPIKRTVDVYVKYVKLARVFLNNCEVEQ